MKASLELSCGLLSGYTLDFDIEEYSTSEEICDFAKSTLINLFTKNNLEAMIEYCKETKFEIHDTNYIEKVLSGNKISICTICKK